MRILHSSKPPTSAMRILHNSDPVKVEKLFNGSDPDLWRRGPVGLNHQQRSIFNGSTPPQIRIRAIENEM
jgi:hypothetical protein